MNRNELQGELQDCSKMPESLKPIFHIFQASIDVEADLKNQQLKVLQETIRNLQTQLMDNNAKDKENLMRITELEDELKRANVKELLLKTKIISASRESINHTTLDTNSNDSDKDVVIVYDTNAATDQLPNKAKLDANKNIIDNDFHVVSIDEVRLIGLISSFLIVHPCGAGLDNIIKYVRDVSNGSGVEVIEHILQRHTNIFARVMSCEDSLVCNETKWKWKWKFCGFQR